MAKPTKTAAKKAAVKKTAVKKPIVSPRRTAAAAAVQSGNAQAQGETSLYEVLTPFKLGGVIVKPPAFVELTADEAAQFQEAGVIADDPGEPDTSTMTEDADAESGGSDGAATGGGSDTSSDGAQG